MTKEAKKLVEEKVGSLDELKKKATDAGSDAASSAAKYAGAIPGLGGLSKVSFAPLRPRIVSDGELTLILSLGAGPRGNRPQGVQGAFREARRERTGDPQLDLRW